MEYNEIRNDELDTRLAEYSYLLSAIENKYNIYFNYCDGCYVMEYFDIEGKEHNLHLHADDIYDARERYFAKELNWNAITEKNKDTGLNEIKYYTVKTIFFRILKGE